MSLTLRNALLSYPHLDQAWSGQEGQAKKYRASFLVRDAETINQIKAAICETYAEATLKSDKFKFPKLKTVTYPNVVKALKNKITFYDPAENQHALYHLGEPEPTELVNYCELRASTQEDRPPIVYSLSGVKLTPVEIKANSFSGQIVHVVVNFYPYNTAGAVGISCGLQGVILTGAEGALGRLGGGVNVAAEFEGLFTQPALPPPFTVEEVDGTPVSDFAL